ncbi:hypothetical protein EB001_10655 [bacterium]|nr:hypothetical protein [bacterium]
MANIIKIKRSGTANSAPLANSLEYGELAINYADGLLFYKDLSNTVVSFDISGAFNITEVGNSLDDLEVSVAMQTF